MGPCSGSNLGSVLSLCVWEQPRGTVSTEGEGVISQSRFCADVTAATPRGSEQGQQDLGITGMLQPRGSHTSFFFPPAKGKDVEGSCFSMCASSCLLLFSLPVYSSAFLRATVPDPLLAVIETSLFLTVFIPYKPCVTS